MTDLANNPIQYIEAPESATLVSQFLTTLPIGILNKKRTGCGATSVALENHENTIVCCPTIQLIKNKVAQYPNERCPYILLGVIGGVKPNEIIDYITKCREEYNQPVKIMVTYNSFYKIKEVLAENINNYKIIVDEYQELLDSCVYREKAILDLLKQLRDLSNVTYLSATPILINYRPEELIGLTEYEIIWKNDDRVTPHRHKTNKPYAIVVNMIQRHKEGLVLQLDHNKVEEYFFFINSVNAIKDIIDKTGLTNDEVKVICSDTNKNKTTLGTITIRDLSTPNKTFNFCTKTVFCGADFHSESGLAVVVSSGLTKSTMLDISTDIQQIAGRIRTSTNPFKNVIYHIYSTELSCKTQSEFDTWLNERIESAQGIIDNYNNLSNEVQRKAIIERIRLNDKEELALYEEDTNEVKLNTLKINHFKYKFESIDNVYKNGMSIKEAYERVGNDTSVAQRWTQVITDYIYNMNGTPSFEVLYEEYLIEKENTRNWGGTSDRIKNIEQMNTLIPLAYKHLLPEKVRALRYNSTDVKNAIHFELPDTQSALKSALREVFIEGGIYTNEDAKALYQHTLDNLQIKRNAKVKELRDKYLDAIDAKPTINGERKNGFKVVRSIINLIFGLDKYQKNSDKNSNPNFISRIIKKVVSFFSVK